MTGDPDIAQLARAVAEPARASMLVHLLDGRGWTATELATVARVSASTASGHLKKLLACNLVKVTPSGRHRYFRLGGERIANLIEHLLCVAPVKGPTPAGAKRASAELRDLRLCYDHLAGHLAIAITEAMLHKLWLIEDDAWFRLTEAGTRALSALGIVPAPGRMCMDWSERRLHVAGPLGTHLAQWLLKRKFALRVEANRALRLTRLGRQALAAHFGLPTSDLPGKRQGV